MIVSLDLVREGLIKWHDPVAGAVGQIHIHGNPLCSQRVVGQKEVVSSESMQPSRSPECTIFEVHEHQVLLIEADRNLTDLKQAVVPARRNILQNQVFVVNQHVNSGHVVFPRQIGNQPRLSQRKWLERVVCVNIE